MATEIPAEVSQEYKRYTPTNQVQVGKDLIGNYYVRTTVFTTPPLSLDAFTAINDAFSGLVTAAEDNDKNDINARNKYYKENWFPAIDSIRLDVNNTAKGSKSVVDLSGFHSTKIIKTKVVKGEKMVLSAEGGESGTKKINYKSETKTNGNANITIIAVPENISVSLVDDTVTFDIPAGTDAKQIIMKQSKKKKGSITGKNRKDSLNVYIYSTNAAGSSPLSNPANVIVP